MDCRIIILFTLWFTYVKGNVEKIIFVAPSAQPPLLDASIDNLLLVPLSEAFPSVRTHINASFPTDISAQGIDTWFLLEGLRPHARYEVRICWLATVRNACSIAILIGNLRSNPLPSGCIHTQLMSHSGLLASSLL